MKTIATATKQEVKSVKTRLEVTKWEVDAAFDVYPRPLGTGLHRFPAACVEKFENLKVSAELGWRFTSVRPEFLRLAVNEAAALAATTAFPTSFLPALAEEKVRAASLWAARQQLIREQTLVLAA
jgi:hypothetical protein